MKKSYRGGKKKDKHREKSTSVPNKYLKHFIISLNHDLQTQTLDLKPISGPDTLFLETTALCMRILSQTLLQRKGAHFSFINKGLV